MFKQVSKGTNIDHHESMTVRDYPSGLFTFCPKVGIKEAL